VPDDGYEYLLGMRDEMSSPAHSASGGLDEMTGALKRSEHAMESHARRAKESEGVLKGVASAFGQGLFGGGGLTTAIAEGELLAHAFEKAGELAREGFKFAIEASEMKEAAIDAYTIIRGTAEEGERTFRELDKAAREIHMPTEQAQKIAQQLMLEGLKGQEAVTDTIRAIGDLQRVGLGAGAEKLQSIISRAAVTGQFKLRGPRELAGIGVTLDDIAKELGIGRKQLETELKTGAISAEAGIQAIDNAILKGKIGALATKRFTVSDALVDLKNSLRAVFQETDSGPLTDALKRVTESFSEGGENADRMREAMDEIVEGAAKLIDVAMKVGDAFSDTWDRIRDEGTATWDWITQHNPLLTDQQKHDAAIRRQLEGERHRLAELVRHQDKGIAEVEEASRKGASPGDLHKIAARYGIEIAAGKAESEAAIDARLARVAASVASEPNKPGFSSTREMVSFHRGPDADAEAAGKDIGDAEIKGRRDAHGAHSPSRALFDLGKDDADGYALGLAAGGGGISGGPQAPSGMMSGGKGGPAVHVDVGGIHITGHIDPDDFLPLLESQIADVFERTALEIGG
jgi:hypothetical protein